jgi:hypothetical protein
MPLEHQEGRPGIDGGLPGGLASFPETNSKVSYSF